MLCIRLWLWSSILICISAAIAHNFNSSSNDAITLSYVDIPTNVIGNEKKPKKFPPFLINPSALVIMGISVLNVGDIMIKQKLVAEIQQALSQLGAEGAHIHIEQPQMREHGDYATNVAMHLAKVLRKAPLLIAKDIVETLNARPSFSQLVQKVEVVNPGFINFFLTWESFSSVEERIAVEPKEQKVIIEHTSINPNKAAHIGHLRNSCIGDTLSRLYRFTGYTVEVHNYIDDLGNQLADTVVGLLYHPLRQEYARFSDYCWDLYAKVNQAYKEDEDLNKKRPEVLHELEEGHSNVAWLGYLVAERIVRDHIEELAEFHIDYDLLVWESNIVREGFWSAAFEQLQRSDQFVKETEGKAAGCWILKQSDEASDEKEAIHQLDKVLVRSNGILTYTAKDIAYHLWKFGLLEKDFRYRPFEGAIWTTNSVGEKHSYGKADIVLNVIDKRQEYPQQMVKLALETLGHAEAADNLKHVSYGVVSLSRETAKLLGIDTSDDKTAYAMSGRQGVGVKISELLDRMERVIEEKRTRKSGISSRMIATAAVRYFLLRYALNTEIVFDMDQATEVSGNTGVYLLYGYTRAHNILKKAEVTQVITPTDVELSQLHPSEHALLRHMITWPEVIQTSLTDMSPNIICNYAFQLASLFNNFYAVCPVMKEEDEKKREFRLWLTSTFSNNLGEVLGILGLPTPTEM